MSIYDKASLVQIPSGYKSGTLYSVVPNTADGDFDFTRGSTATRVNKDGLIETAAIGVPRLNYPLLDGVVQDCPTLLLEPSRSNLVQRSEEFDNSYWLKSLTSVTANQVISPDGSQTADILTKNGDYGSLYRTGISATSGSNYTFSVFVKKGTTDFLSLRQASGSNDVRKQFDLNTGAVTNGLSANQTGFVSSNFEEYSNGWYRLSITCTSNSTSITVGIYSGKVGESTFNGNSYIWGAQFEAGSYPTSYIPTNGEVGGVTRSADDCVDAGTAADFNDSEGVLYVNAKIDDPSEADDNDFSLGDGSFVSNSVEISFKNISASSQSIVGKCAIDGSSISLTGTTITDTSIKHDLFHKVAYQYKQADFKMFVNGFKIGTSTYNDIFPSGGLVRVSFEGNGTAGTKFRGNTKEVMTFNEALSDTELEALTSYDSFKEMATEQLYTIE
jgi:hypothetical protein